MDSGERCSLSQVKFTTKQETLDAVRPLVSKYEDIERYSSVYSYCPTYVIVIIILFLSVILNETEQACANK